MVGLGQTKAKTQASRQQAWDELFFLCRRAKVSQHQRHWRIAHNGTFVLQIVVQPQTLGGQVFTNDGHGQVAAVLPAKFCRQGVPVVPRQVGSAPHFSQERLPIVVRQAAGIKISPRKLAAVVKKTDVVVLLLQRLDLALNERVKLGQISLDGGGNGEVHGSTLNQFPGPPRRLCKRALRLYTTSRRNAGKRITSRMLGLSVSSIIRRSMPTPQPPVGGMPYSRARTKSWS